jgi:hypothetical protein
MFLTPIENDYATYTIDDGIVHIIYKNGISLNLNAAVKVVQDRLKLQNDTFYPVLCDILGIKAANKSARDYLALEGSVFVSAVAFIIKPSISASLSEFYLRASKPSVPTKVFTELEAAKKFLSQFKSKTNP